MELEAEVKKLNIKVSKAKGLGVTEYKELGAYKLDLEATASLFLMIERIKLLRLL